VSSSSWRRGVVYWFGFRDKPRAAATTQAAKADDGADPWDKAPRKAERSEGPAPTGPMPKLSFEIDPPGRLLLEGQVLDEDDHPVKGAKVRISTSPARTTETDADGSFSFDQLLGRTYSLTATAGDKFGGPVATKVVASAEPVVIRLRQGVALTVNVSDAASKQAIAGATVTLLDGSETTATTDGGGKAVFRGLRDGWTGVMAVASGYGPVTANKLVGKGEKTATVEVALRRGAAVSGRVVDEQGTGIPDVQVWAADTSNAWERGGAELARVTSAADGAFTIPALAAGSYFLRAKDDHHAPASTAPITVTGEHPTTGIEIVMKAAASIAGVVVTTDGQPVPYATVKLSSKTWSPDSVNRQAAADEHGKFELRALPRAAVKVRAESEEAASKAIDVDLAGTPVRTDVKLVLDQAGTIAGIVVDGAGEPIAEAEVAAYPDFLDDKRGADDFVLAQGAAATTDGGGRFVLKGLEDGSYRVWASRSSGGRTSQGQREGVAARTGAKDVKIVLPAPGAVKGKVALDSGDPPELALVSTDWEHRVTIRDGAFELADLAPGKYDLRVTGADFADKIVRDLTIEAGKTTDAGTITVRAGRKLSGRVIDGEGKPVEGARVLFGKMLFGDGKQTGGTDPDQASAMGQRGTSTDADGRFVLTGLSRGGGSLMAEHADRGRSLAIKIPPGKDDVRDVALNLKGFGSIAGRVTRKGEPVAGAIVYAAPQGSTGAALQVAAGADGSFVIDKVPEGVNSVSAMKPGMMSMQGAARTVTVVAGQRADGSVEIPVGEVALTVTSKPKAGAVVNAAQVFLLRGRYQLTTGDQLVDGFFGGQVPTQDLGKTELALTGPAGMLFWLGGDTHPTFKDLNPGPYSACLIPVTGNIMGDQRLMQRILRNVDKLEVVCKQVEVTAAPLAQAITVELPTMRELTDDDE